MNVSVNRAGYYVLGGRDSNSRRSSNADRCGRTSRSSASFDARFFDRGDRDTTYTCRDFVGIVDVGSDAIVDGIRGKCNSNRNRNRCTATDCNCHSGRTRVGIDC